ncbi:MAG TPA: DinB family protein [Bryobacteraceae bacterium]|nr:DinB family protein [Bryobacteraceae bacterium]
MTIYEQLRFGDRIESAHKALLSISEEHASDTFREGGWTRKEILGHLIDSALNNHQRFVRAALDGSYEGPSYAQADWVNIHGYGSMPWASLLEHWRLQNRLLGEVIRHIPEARLETPCRVGSDSPVTLRFLVEDYVQHLDYHLRQVLSTS